MTGGASGLESDLPFVVVSGGGWGGGDVVVDRLECPRQAIFARNQMCICDLVWQRSVTGSTRKIAFLKIARNLANLKVPHTS